MRLPVLLLLIGHLVLAGIVAPRLVGASTWAQRRPTWGLAAAHAAAGATVVGWLALGALAAHDGVERVMMELLHVDKTLLHDAYAGDGAVDPAWTLASLLVVALVGALTMSAARSTMRVRRERAHHRQRACAPSSSGDLQVVTGVEPPSIWCIPGPRGGTIFATASAVELLTAAELRGAVGHERAHLRRRHHLMVLAADVVTSILGPVGFLRRYPEIVRFLVELDADDVAARTCTRRVLAFALYRLGSASVAPGTLGANDTATDRRIRRLLDRHGSQSTTAPLHAGLAILVLFATPVAAVAGPALALAGTAH